MKSYVETVETNNSFNVVQLASIYSFPVYIQTDAVVAIISFGGGIYGTIENNILTNGDVQQYWEYQGITNMSTVKVFFENGVVNDLSDNKSTLENTLDVGIIGSCCKCTILLYIFPPNTTFIDAFLKVYNQIIPSIICLTWGKPETDINILDINATNALIKSKGINVVAASGDSGSLYNNKLSVNFPASSPYVTAVGGTTLFCSNLIYDINTVETVWINTGGGISVIHHRDVPDLAFAADPNTGIQLFLNGTIQKGIGGTSISAPLFAGFLALSGKKEFINPLLYANPQCFNDITVGTNGTYTARIGYDDCTGLGSLNGYKLLNLPIIVTQIIIPPKIIVNIKHIYRLFPIIIPDNATNKNIVWSSSNIKVAVVHYGIVSPIGVGIAIITATCGNVSASTTATIYNPIGNFLFTRL
uniref:Peptidase S53 domain-containing protein n=1 Tax=viral metagenome TaxID=1070528 RepID=A0A6C0EUT2_9ZZZZ